MFGQKKVPNLPCSCNITSILGLMGLQFGFKTFIALQLAFSFKFPFPISPFPPHSGFPPKLLIRKLHRYVSCAGPVYSQFHFH